MYNMFGVDFQFMESFLGDSSDQQGRCTVVLSQARIGSRETVICEIEVSESPGGQIMTQCCISATV